MSKKRNKKQRSNSQTRNNRVAQNKKISFRIILRNFIISIFITISILFIIYLCLFQNPNTFNATVNSGEATYLKSISCKNLNMNLLCEEAVVSCEGPLEIEFGRGIVNGRDVTCTSIDLDKDIILSDTESETLRIIPKDTCSTYNDLIRIKPLYEDTFEWKSEFGFSSIDNNEFKVSINDSIDTGYPTNELLRVSGDWIYIDGDAPIILSFNNNIASVFFGQEQVSEPVIIYPTKILFNEFENMDCLFSIASHSTITPEKIKPFKVTIPFETLSGSIQFDNVSESVVKLDGLIKYNMYNKEYQLATNMNETYLNSPNALSVQCLFDKRKDNKFSYSFNGDLSIIKAGKNAIDYTFSGWLQECVWNKFFSIVIQILFQIFLTIIPIILEPFFKKSRK